MFETEVLINGELSATVNVQIFTSASPRKRTHRWSLLGVIYSYPLGREEETASILVLGRYEEDVISEL